jgi:prevent-host-death family protein
VIKVSAAEFQRNIGRYQDLALREPVAVTRNGRERTVMISVEEYRRLTRRAGAPPRADASSEDQPDEHEEPTGEVLIQALLSSPHRDIEIEPERGFRTPDRDVEL